MGHLYKNDKTSTDTPYNKKALLEKPSRETDMPEKEQKRGVGGR